MAKVEQKGTLSKSDLREFFREMLLIRRFEEKVEERFRAGELPGFLHVAIGRRWPFTPPGATDEASV